jgi:chemotaxis protein methyltransferase CheR
MAMIEMPWATQVEAKDLTKEEYELFRRLVYAKSGINLGDSKQQLVRARLGKRVRQGRFASFRSYYEYIEKDGSGEELQLLLDAITTNTTHLFREKRHFDFLHQLVTRWAQGAKSPSATLRIWSAACSSGEEPHSMAMVVHDALRETRFAAKILATDLSGKVLNRARQGIYECHKVGSVPSDYRSRYFLRIQHNGQVCLELTPEVRNLITFSRFNLMTPTFPFRHGFDVVFCRNVMIYFDRPTQEGLIGRIVQHLRPGGYLMIGHSESLNGVRHPLKYVEPTIYRKT